MIFTKEQIKIAYEKLSSEDKYFISSEETIDLIEVLIKKEGFTEEQEILVDSEILFAMYGLQTLSEAIQNIANLSNKNVSDLSKLQKDLEENIFSKINHSNLASDQEEKLTKVHKSNPLGKSFEETILNQARGMMPARHASQGDAGEPAGPADENTSNDTQDTKSELRNPSYEEGEKNNKPIVDVPNYGGAPYKNSTNYPTGDPYREPAE